MNKQELITRIEKIKYEHLHYNSPESMLLEQKHLILDLVEQLDEPLITDEQAWNKIAEAYPESVQSLRNTLDNAVFGNASTQQQPVVPQFVADLVDWTVRANGAPCDVIREFQTNTPDTVNLPGTLELEKLDEYFEKAYCRYDFEKACFVGYEVEVPVWYVKIGKGYFSGFDDTKVTYVIDDAPGALAQRIKYDSKEEAEMDALQIGGTVEEVAEG